jgi:hypothetical protein
MGVFVMKFQIAISVCAIIVFNGCILGGDEREKSLRAIKRYKESQKWTEKYSIDMVTTSREMEPANDLNPSRRAEVTIKKLNSCLSISGVIDTFSINSPKRSLRVNSVVNRRMGMYQSHEIGKKPNGASVSVDVAKKLDDYLTDFLINGSILEGYMAGIDGKCLADLVLESPDVNLFDRESIDGISCLRILTKTRYGSVKLWLDEQNGFLPRQYVFDRVATDLGSNGKRIRDENFYGAGNGNLKDVFAASLTKKMDRVEIGKAGSTFYILKARILTDDSLSNGQRVRYETIYERIKFDPTPTFSEEDFKIDLPNGTSINNEDDSDSGVVYEWQDGKVVPVSSDLAGAAEGKWPKRSMNWIATWVITGSVLLFFALRYIWRYKQKGA